MQPNTKSILFWFAGFIYTEHRPQTSTMKSFKIHANRRIVLFTIAT